MVAIVIVTFVWIIIGFSLSFDGGNQWIGGLKFLGSIIFGFETSKTLSPHIPLSYLCCFK